MSARTITKITDSYGDSLTLETAVEETDYLFVTAEEDNDRAQIELDRNAQIELRDAITRHLGGLDPNEAKLRLAADYGLRAKFAYKGQRDYRAIERRLEVEEVYANGDHLLVSGTSYDDGGRDEGYRQFRLDRISGEVVVR